MLISTYLPTSLSTRPPPRVSTAPSNRKNVQHSACSDDLAGPHVRAVAHQRQRRLLRVRDLPKLFPPWSFFCQGTSTNISSSCERGTVLLEAFPRYSREPVLQSCSVEMPGWLPSGLAAATPIRPKLISSTCLIDELQTSLI